MINFPSSPPQAVREDLALLRDALDASIPPKTLDRNVLIATWNIRAFGQVTPLWTTGAADSPKRGLGHVLYIAEIVSRFDVIALQEVKRDLGGLRLLMKALGPEWGWILTDLTRGDEGNQERMAFVFDLRRVKPSGLAAELVVPIETQTSLTEVGLQKQFARTPYAVSFQSQGATFTLVTLHVIWGSNAAQRLPEITEIALWLADWANGGDEFGENLMTLGDFNIDRQGDPLYQAFVATGLTPAPEHVGLPRTLFDDPITNPYYDRDISGGIYPKYFEAEITSESSLFPVGGAFYTVTSGTRTPTSRIALWAIPPTRTLRSPARRHLSSRSRPQRLPLRVGMGSRLHTCWCCRTDPARRELLQIFRQASASTAFLLMHWRNRWRRLDPRLA